MARVTSAVLVGNGANLALYPLPGFGRQGRGACSGLGSLDYGLDTVGM